MSKHMHNPNHMPASKGLKSGEWTVYVVHGSIIFHPSVLRPNSDLAITNNWQTTQHTEPDSN